MKRGVTAALMLFVVLALGCGKSEHSGKTAVGGTTKELGSGSIDLPAAFPSDVPILKDATVRTAVSQGNRMVVELYTSSPVAETVKFYDLALKSEGWKIERSMNTGEATIIFARKGKSLCGVTVGKDGKKTLVQLTLSREAS